MKKILLFIGAIIVAFAYNIPTNAATSTSQAGQVDTNGANLNVRTSNSTSSTIKDKLKDNSYLIIISTKGNFYYVEYKDGVYGYVHKDYVDIISSNVKRVNTGGANLNVRTGPSINYPQFEKVSHNDYVIILSNEGSFSKILFEGNKVGYASNNYLSSTYTYTSKYLSVPSYKQYDSRWANLTIGSSGKTIKQIGCLTTAMAMSESYRTGTTITPAYIRNNYSYTSDGSLYWPSRYTTSTSSNYLIIIYNQLKNNKPVLIGLKTANGGQHWVIVTSFVGGNTLSASNFVVNDPGSSTRTRLNQVIANYPYFYKIAYYK